MHDVVNFDALRKKRRDRERFMFLANVTGDEQKTLAALALAAVIFNDYELSQKGYVRISIPDAAKKARMAESSMYEARNWLVTRGYLVRVPGTGNRKGCYTLGPGPDNSGWPE
jgi:hypothetical protein